MIIDLVTGGIIGNGRDVTTSVTLLNNQVLDPVCTVNMRLYEIHNVDAFLARVAECEPTFTLPKAQVTPASKAVTIDVDEVADLRFQVIRNCFIFTVVSLFLVIRFGKNAVLATVAFARAAFEALMSSGSYMVLLLLFGAIGVVNMVVFNSLYQLWMKAAALQRRSKREMSWFGILLLAGLWILFEYILYITYASSFTTIVASASFSTPSPSPVATPVPEAVAWWTWPLM